MMPLTVAATDRLGRMYIRTAIGPTDDTARYFSAAPRHRGLARGEDKMNEERETDARLCGPGSASSGGWA